MSKSTIPSASTAWTLLNRSKRSKSFSFLWNNALVLLSNMLKYFYRKLGLFLMISDFWYLAIGHNGNSSCMGGWHYAFCQISQKSQIYPYILITAILGPTLLIHTCLVPESWIFQFILLLLSNRALYWFTAIGSETIFYSNNSGVRGFISEEFHVSYLIIA